MNVRCSFSAPELETADLDALMAGASAVRDRAWGKTITYSRKVFVPLTIDHINPDHAGPAVARQRTTTEAEGFALQERLTVYPRFFGRDSGFVTCGIGDKLEALVRADGLARDQQETAA